jgi:6-phosphogluconolactonase
VQGAGPAEVLFDNYGESLVVTDRMSHEIEVFGFADRRLQTLYKAPSSGRTPSGFAFAHNDVLVVSDARASTASRYHVTDAALTPISEAVSITQRAACWLVVTNSGKLAYTANAQSSSVSSYAVSPKGRLQLIEAAAGTTPRITNPTDLALNRNSLNLRNWRQAQATLFTLFSSSVLSSSLN